MQLKEEYRNYDELRREHDMQLVSIALEAGIRLSPDQWSSLLYGDDRHKSHMQSIIDKVRPTTQTACPRTELTPLCTQLNATTPPFDRMIRQLRLTLTE